MKSPIEQRALEAVRAYSSANREIKRLNRVIGDALGECFTSHVMAHGGFESDNLPSWESHLQRAYGHDIGDEESGEPRRIYKSAKAQAAILAECQFCMKAHNAIQQRKLARQKFGVAKRQITSLGREAA